MPLPTCRWNLPPVRANPGPVFKQWVGIELWKRLQYLGGGRLHYLRTKAGAEVDEHPKDARRLRHLSLFYPTGAHRSGDCPAVVALVMTIRPRMSYERDPSRRFEAKPR